MGQQIQYGSTGLQHSGVSMMTNQKMHPTSTQQMTMATNPTMKIVGEMPQPVVNPNQYHLKDNLGNYAFGYSTQNSEMAEEGNAQSKKGHFANIMADGKMRRGDYIADDQGFHILRDTADNTGKYIKREAETSVEPDLIRTRMTSYMDSSSLRDDNKDMHKMSNDQMGRDMSSSMMQRNNQLTSNMYRTNNLMGHDMSTMNMLGRDLSSMNNMMGRDKSFVNMMGRDMSSRNKLMGYDMSSRNNMMGQRLNNMMGRDMSSINMMGRDMSSRNNLVGHDMSANQMGRDMYSNQMLSSNTMGQVMSRMAPLNTMSQGLQIQSMPSQSLNRFF